MKTHFSSPASQFLRVAFACALFQPMAQGAFPQMKLEIVCQSQLYSPVAMVHAGDATGRMFIVEQRGAIRIFRNGVLQPGNFLDIGRKLVPERTGFDERGLLGLAFHPGYGVAASPGFGKFYVFYIAPSPNAPGPAANPVDSQTIVSEFKVSSTNPDVADPDSERILLSFDKPQFNHAGGGMEFGPDGLLYFTVGDGGSSNDNNVGHTGGGPNPRPTNGKGNAQDLTKLLGKMHRIDPLGTNGPGGQYGIPATNPFATSPNGERPEIYAYGLRNCWRFSFDKRPGGTNQLFGADVGQGSVEEINLITLGGNYGWRNREGTFVPSFSVDAPALAVPPIDPIAQYAHPGVIIGNPPLPQLGLSVTGGYIYRGSAIPALSGKYIFGDWSQNPVLTPAPATPTAKGVMLGLEETAPGVWALSQLDILGGNPINLYIQGFGEDAQGELYVLTKLTQPVTAVDPATGLPTGVILKLVPVPATTALVLTASRDTTLYQESAVGNGAGEWIFAGATEPSKNDDAMRRALLGWNLSTVPAGAVIASASVSLRMDRTISPSYSFSLHKMLANWGEGSANAGSQEGDGSPASATDATWLKPFFGQAGLWTTPGGDFSGAGSASLGVNASAAYTWNSPGLAADVNAWLANPDTNFGWVLKADIGSARKTGTGTSGQPSITVSDTNDLVAGMIISGNGIGPGAKIAAGGIDSATNILTLTAPNASAVSGNLYFGAPSAKRFASRTSATTANRPRLNLAYVPAPPPPTSRRKLWEQQSYLIGQFIDDSLDLDADGIGDGVEYAWGFPPRVYNDLSSGFVVDASKVSASNEITINFRRDPLATDLTYALQTGSNLVDWITLVTSTAGGVPAGPGFVSEAVTEAPFLNVMVKHTVVPGSSKQLYRLKVTRQ